MRKLVKVVLLIAVCGGAVALLNGVSSTDAQARPPVGKCECANLDAPVICNGGKVYANQCVANCFNATGCVPYGW